eukprot:CAMPEP_0168397482 /NCGR_PEP_ID=MMETSP0228-20121227/21087_1 /TAXON_ID=133427 /ORGANISM="Protoceratium reticulatum, Strain CCCM 535 (=CCMP 1889)" /LENGTH=96 /DNA_ID=CAMNT_0008410957 /DNA_START=181 /DNA_END=468 /DNA_ORIENTATION=-
MTAELRRAPFLGAMHRRMAVSFLRARLYSWTAAARPEAWLILSRFRSVLSPLTFALKWTSCLRVSGTDAAPGLHAQPDLATCSPWGHAGGTGMERG